MIPAADRPAIPGGDLVALHNVGAIAAQAEGGIALRRVPETVRSQLNPWARERMCEAAGTEIRWVVDGDGAVEIDLGALDGAPVVAQLFHGDFLTTRRERIEAGTTTLRFEPGWFEGLDEELGPTAFASRVRRLVLLEGRPCLYAVRGPARPPTPAELPALRLLAYGTSITQRHSASAGHLAYAPQTAWRLGADLVNLGSAGSAHCEAAIADHIAARDDWHLAVLALSTNMNGFAPEEFERRVRYLVHGVAAAHPDRLVACITLWPKAADLGPAHRGDRHAAPPDEYRRILREVVAACPQPRVHLLEGPDLLPHWRGLTPDLVHPGDYGHAVIAGKLERELRRLLAGEPQLPRPL